MDGGDGERERLLRRYEVLPKTEHWLIDSSVKHAEVRPEWIAAIIEDPYEVIPESRGRQSIIVLAGRVLQFRQWIRWYWKEEATAWYCLRLTLIEDWKKDTGGYHGNRDAVGEHR